MNKLNTQIDPDKKEQWIRALGEDDADLAVSLMEINVEENAWNGRHAAHLLCEVMAFTPLPQKVLDRLDKIAPIEGKNWFVDVEHVVGHSGQNVDWKGLLEWRKRSSPDTAEREAESDFNIMLVSFMESHQRGLGSRRTRTAILEILDMYPEFAARVDHKTVSPSYLFILATAKKDKNWLHGSGADIENIIYWAVKTGWAGALPYQTSEESNVQSLKGWINSHPIYRETWERLQAWDERRADAKKGWHERWADGEKYKESSLYQWCEKVAENPNMLEYSESPLNHPFFQSDLPPISENLVSVAAKTYQMYEKSLVKSGNSYHSGLSTANNSIFNQIKFLARDDLVIGMDPVSLTMADSFSFTDEIMSNPDMQDKCSQILEDCRMNLVVSKWKVNDVIRWSTLDHWVNWKSKSGDALIEVFLKAKPTKIGRVNKALITRLARKNPLLFTATNSTGGGIIKNLGMEDNVISQVIRAALSSMAKQSKTEKTQFEKTRAKIPRM